MYEPKHVRPISTSQFLKRLLRHASYGAVIVGCSLAVGTLGFNRLASQKPLTAFENAAMLLGGMGPVGNAEEYPRGGKWFAAFFALYAGLVFIIVAGLLVAPVLHRMLHYFHWEGAKK